VSAHRQDGGWIIRKEECRWPDFDRVTIVAMRLSKLPRHAGQIPQLNS
jgi:hypothetical protein